MRNSRIILSKGIKLDRNYNQVLSYSESQMLELLLDQNHLVSSRMDYNFIRERGSIKVQETYANCLKANYIGFQNTDYSGKWFFAFIDKVKYLSENATEIYYTVDIWSTWFSYWNPQSCYIVRQHATTDVAGDNLVPEKLEHGEYIVNGINYKEDDTFSDYSYIVVSTNKIPQDQQTGTAQYVSMGGAVVNGYVHALATPTEVDDIIKIMNSQTAPNLNEVMFVYMIPTILIPAEAIDDPTSGLLKSWSSPYVEEKKVLSRPTSLDGYTPINKKLLTYPYQFCYFTNLSGSSNILYYELSGRVPSGSGLEEGAIYIKYMGVPTIGGSVIAIPKYYKNFAEKLDEALILGKYPTLGWSEDAYTNWLTQNAVNNTARNVSTGLQIVGGLGAVAGGIALSSTGVGAGIGTGLISSGVSLAATGGISAGETAMEYYKHSIEPDSYKGNTNAGDILTCIGAMGFSFIGMSITRQYAERLDKYFTRYGYAYNNIALPNMLHRQNYNFIQIAKDSTTAYSNNYNNICVPAGELESINNMFRNGITVWNNHSNFGDYSVTNNITS